MSKQNTGGVKTLQALTSAALAIPGLASAQVQTEYLYAQYREADLPRSQVASGSGERYEIDSHRFRIAAPLQGAAASLNLTYEALSGASPWFVMPDAGSGRPVQVMSGASIREERVDAEVSVAYPVGEDLNVAVSAGYSVEDDYEALNGGVEFEFTPAGQRYSYTGGIGYSYDQLEPTDARTRFPDRIDKADKDSLNLFGGVSFVLGPQTVLQTSLGYGWGQGYLSDPYKLAYITSQANTINDRRPGDRKSWTASARLRHYIKEFGAALHADYRYYDDNWQINAHTLELAWHQTFAETWRVSPSLRWYSQSQAYFYAPFYDNVRADGLASSDYRLSPFGAISLRLDVRKVIDTKWELGAGVERYEASADYALGSVRVENPGLVEFTSIYARINYRY